MSYSEGIVDIEGVQILKSENKLIESEKVSSTKAISDKFYRVKAKDFRKVNVYHPLKFNIDFKLHYDILEIIKSYIAYYTDENIDDIEVQKLFDVHNGKVMITLTINDIPIYIIDKEYLISIINGFKDGDTYLCRRNPLLADQVNTLFRNKKINLNVMKIDNFYYYNKNNLEPFLVNYIDKLKTLLPEMTIKDLDIEVADRIGLLSYNVVTLDTTKEFISPEELVEKMIKYKGNYFEINREIEDNIERIRQGENPIFKYEKDIEFNLIESILNEREKEGKLEDVDEIKIDEGHVTCPTSKEFFNALNKIKFENHHVYHTVDFNDACAFRVKLSKRKVKNVMIPTYTSKDLTHKKNTYFVYYKSDYIIEKVTDGEMKKFKASVIDVYGMDKDTNKSMGELFSIKTINGVEIKDDTSIMGFISDHHTLGLKEIE